jgi:hypothetical protein
MRSVDIGAARRLVGILTEAGRFWKLADRCKLFLSALKGSARGTMKFGLWVLSAAGIGAVGTLLAASLPVPPSLPSNRAPHFRAVPTQVAATPAPAQPATPPATPQTPAAAPPPQAAAAPPAQASGPSPAAAEPWVVPPTTTAQRPKRVVAAAGDARSTGQTEKAKRPTRKMAKAMADRHRRTVAHAAPKPPPPYSGTRERTHVAMAPPPPWSMPSPYWRSPYPPDYW